MTSVQLQHVYPVFNLLIVHNEYRGHEETGYESCDRDELVKVVSRQLGYVEHSRRSDKRARLSRVTGLQRSRVSTSVRDRSTRCASQACATVPRCAKTS